MKHRIYHRLGEDLFHAVLDNGLSIYVDRRPQFQKSFAFFATHYGGMDMRYQLDGVWKDTPAGVAHYLEHKMFDTKDGNALQMLAGNGASPNAFTGSAMTGYYVECTDRFEENLKILLSFVSVPYFTKESIEKEQGIIGQEIRMVEDDPNNQAFFSLMECLYDHHPIRVPIAGSQESISHIAADTLYECHQAFYCPSNMVLTVAGNVDPEKICSIARDILPTNPGKTILRDYGGEEPDRVSCPFKKLEMEVSNPIFLLGFKGTPARLGGDSLRQRLLGDLAFEALLGNSSPLYARLYSAGMIQKDFFYAYQAYPGCAFLCAGGESKAPEAVRDAVLAEAERISHNGIDPELFSRLKKGCYGAEVRALNSMENTCIELAEAHFSAYDYLRFPEVYEELTPDEAAAFIGSWVTENHCALTMVTPREAEV